ncbi:MAG: AAA family ATPase [Candidatus Rokubacteria bacterium]|nr:AAA family ATPase [Candidatus Rokubacteria bacterium]
MICTVCRVANAVDRRFCAECGAPLGLRCPSCGFINGAAARFCGGCGARTAAAGIGDGARGAPELPSAVAREGERKLVSVLFADLKGSMEVVADRDPEEARALLDAVLERLIQAVRDFGGTVNQVLGDGIMAIIGAPVAHEDHAVRACLSALCMHQLVRGAAAELRARFGVEAMIRVGISSGDVLVRGISTGVHVDVSAVGQTTHLASRMEQLAAPGSTLIARSTWWLVRGRIASRPLGPVAVKGLADPIEVFELLAGPAARARGAALGRFVGRHAELARLRSSLHLAGGTGRIVSIVGEPGVGKSRLVDEFLGSDGFATVRVLRGSALSYARTIPYAPVIEVLRTYFAVAEGDEAHVVRDKVERALGALAPGLSPLARPLLGLLGAVENDPEWHALDPPERRRRSASALRRLFVHESQRQPLCLVLEDLHWLDADTEALLDEFVDFLPALALLAVVTYRPEYRPRWSAAPQHDEVRLDPLSPADAGAVLDDLIGSDPSTEDAKRWLATRTQGNPFFLEETVAHLVDTGVLDVGAGAARLRRPIDTTLVPATVQGVLAARIDRLPPPARTLLQCAAVIGQEVPLGLLRAISALPPDELRAALVELEGAEFLGAAGPAPPALYAFRHALIHDVAYDSVLRDRRRALHAAVVGALESASSERPPEIEALATHALAAERWDQAVRYCRQAGSRALAQAANRVAITWFERALEALPHLPADEDTSRTAIDLRLELRYALSPLGDFTRMVAYLEEAERLAVDLGDRRRLGLVSAFMANYFSLTGRPNRATRYAERALDIGREVGDLALEVLASAFMAGAAYARGDYPGATAAAERTVALVEGDRERERFDLPLFPAVYSRTILVSALAERGEFDRAEAIAADAIRIAAAFEHPYSLAYAHLGLGALHMRRTDFAAARPALETALEQCRRANLPAVSTLVASALVTCYANGGDAERATAFIDTAIEQATGRGDPLGFWLRSAGRAEVLLRAGRLDEALPLAREGVELLRFIRNRGHEGHALLVLADTLAGLGAAEAGPTYAAVIEHAEALGMPPLAARARLGLGALHAAAGRREEARAALEAAAALGGRLGMPGVTDGAARALLALSDDHCGP